MADKKKKKICAICKIRETKACIIPSPEKIYRIHHHLFRDLPFKGV